MSLSRRIFLHLSAGGGMAVMPGACNTQNPEGSCCPTDDYRTAIPISDLDDRELSLVWAMNVEDLPQPHGCPPRMLVPGRYAMKNPGWLVEIAFGDEELLGTWESGGWSKDATIQPVAYALEEAQCSVDDGADVHLAGAALAGTSAIDSVGISDDDGETWTRAGLVYRGDPDSWTTWSVVWTPPAPGQYTLLVRARSTDGRLSEPEDDDRLDGYGGYDEITIVVS